MGDILLGRKKTQNMVLSLSEWAKIMFQYAF